MNKTILFLAAISAAVCIQEAKAGTQTAELGAMVNTGNSDSVSVRGALIGESESITFKHAYSAALGFAQSKSGGERSTTGQRLALVGQSNYKLDADYSLFGRAAYTNDRFASYRQEAAVAAGAGLTVFDDPTSKLDLVTGPGFKCEEGPLGSGSGALWFAAASYGRNFDANTFTQAFEVSQSLAHRNSTIVSRTAYRSFITGSMSLRVGFDLRNDSLPAMGKRSTSTETSVSVQTAF